MRISAIPYADMNTATTRLRFYAVLGALPPPYTWGLCGKRADGHVLYVQKKADDKTLKIVEHAKRDGVKVVYDLGDPPRCEDGARRKSMMEMADVVTTDTEGRRFTLLEYAKRVMVVPDCVDYEGTYCEFRYNPEVRRIATFGNTDSIRCAAYYMNPLTMKQAYITNRKSSDFLNAKFVEWKYRSFIKNLANNDVCFLAQSEEAKSNNRLLVCMRLGIPFIVSDSTSYRKTLEEIGLSSLIARDSDGIHAIIMNFMRGSVDIRRKIAMVARRHVDKFTAEKSAEKLVEAFKMAVANA